MRRLLLMLLTLFALASPARADDISAAGRGVVRVVVVAFEDGEVSDFGHGSGFAVAANRIVTNAHVVALAAQQQDGDPTGLMRDISWAMYAVARPGAPRPAPSR